MLPLPDKWKATKSLFFIRYFIIHEIVLLVINIILCVRSIINKNIYPRWGWRRAAISIQCCCKIAFYWHSFFLCASKRGNNIAVIMEKKLRNINICYQWQKKALKATEDETSLWALTRHEKHKKCVVMNQKFTESASELTKFGGNFASCVVVCVWYVFMRIKTMKMEKSAVADSYHFPQENSVVGKKMKSISVDRFSF